MSSDARWAVRTPTSTLVFCQPDGKPVHLRNIVTRDFRPVTKKAKLPRIRFHDLRHSHATDLLAHSEHPKVVSERLGHNDPAFTCECTHTCYRECRRRRPRGWRNGLRAKDRLN